MAFRSTSTANTNSTSINIPVPTGAAAGDRAILSVCIDNTGHGTITWPSGFNLLGTKIEVTSPDGHSMAVAEKILTGADTGNYTPSWTGAADVIGMCCLFSGRHASTASTLTQDNSTSGSSGPSINAAAPTITPPANADLCWIGGGDGSLFIVTAGTSAWAPPSGFTERQDVTDQTRAWCNQSMASQDNVPASATGTVTGVLTISSGTAGWMAFLIAIPEAAASTPYVVQDQPIISKRQPRMIPSGQLAPRRSGNVLLQRIEPTWRHPAKSLVHIQNRPRAYGGDRYPDLRRGVRVIGECGHHPR